MAPQEETFDSGTPLFALIERAERKAKTAVDPENFSFLDHLNNGGVIMPTEQLVLYTNVRASAEIQELRAKFDGLVAQHSADAHARVQGERQARFEALAAEVTADRHFYKKGAEDDVDSLGDEPEERVLTPLQKLALMEPEYRTQITEQVENEIPVPAEIIPDEAAGIPDQIVALAKDVWDNRLELTVVGAQPKDVNKAEDIIQAERYNKNVRNLEAADQINFLNVRRSHELVASCVRKIHVPSSGKTDDFTSTPMHATVAGALCAALPPSELKKLIDLCNVLTHATALIDPKVDAGFPG